MQNKTKLVLGSGTWVRTMVLATDRIGSVVRHVKDGALVDFLDQPWLRDEPKWGRAARQRWPRYASQSRRVMLSSVVLNPP
jgi:hypothetical protein